MKSKAIKILIIAVVFGLVGGGLFLVNESVSDVPAKSTKLSSDKSLSVIDETSLLEHMTIEDVTFDDQKINVYLFWGEGCPHCKNLAAYLQSILPEYGEYFDLFTFEVYQNEENIELMKQVGEKLGEKPAGVPFLVIGDQSWAGYGKSMDEKITRAIREQFEKTDDRIDVLN